MSCPSYSSLEDAITGTFGEDVLSRDDLNMSGSRFNSTRVLVLTGGRKVFLKVSDLANRAAADAEEEGINAISDTGAIAVPEVYCKGIDPSRGISFLITEFIEQGAETKDALIRMGNEFALMHKADTGSFVSGGKYGFIHDNFIGASKQINTPCDSWVEFFRQCRMEPQLRMAMRDLGPEHIKRAQRLMDKLDQYLYEPEYPSLLHGDMWGGNYLIDKTGRAVLIDPAAYVGCAEADLAMTYMFSPMPPAFYKGYREVIPEEDGFRDRVDLYNLYHILNHYNLFGGYYLNAVVRIITRYAG
ncbi:MAG: fructosamine kinase family protein [Clostridiales bacterium]|nr:fructosamine kinase family protein [Clostridiales bacterium]